MNIELTPTATVAAAKAAAAVARLDEAMAQLPGPEDTRAPHHHRPRGHEPRGVLVGSLIEFGLQLHDFNLARQAGCTTEPTVARQEGKT
jgi:hypothetical protein